MTTDTADSILDTFDTILMQLHKMLVVMATETQLNQH